MVFPLKPQSWRIQVAPEKPRSTSPSASRSILRVSRRRVDFRPCSGLGLELALFGDGSKLWYLVNPKIAGIYGCS